MVSGNVCSSRVGFPKKIRSMPLLRVAALFCVLMTGTFNGTNETGQWRRPVIPDLNELPTFDEDDESYDSSVVDDGNVVNGNADDTDGDNDPADPSDYDDNDGGDEDLEPSSSDDGSSDDRDDDDDDGSAEDREDHGEDDSDDDDDEDDAVLAIGFYMMKK